MKKGEKIIMKKIWVLCLGITALVMFSGLSYADQEQNDQSREKKVYQNYSGAGSASVSSCCIEGYVFVLMTGNVSNYTSVVQVYEERNGKVVPKRCD
jgi:hypothetical protein